MALEKWNLASDRGKMVKSLIAVLWQYLRYPRCSTILFLSWIPLVRFDIGLAASEDKYGCGFYMSCLVSIVGYCSIAVRGLPVSRFTNRCCWLRFMMHLQRKLFAHNKSVPKHIVIPVTLRQAIHHQHKALSGASLFFCLNRCFPTRWLFLQCFGLAMHDCMVISFSVTCWWSSLTLWWDSWSYKKVLLNKVL